MRTRRDGDEPGEAEWVRALQRREPWAWERLHQVTLEPVFAYVRRHCARREDAEDVTAEVYLAAVSGIDSFRGGASVTTWLIGIARRKLADHARRLHRRPELLEADLGDGAEVVIAGNGRSDAAQETPEAAVVRRDTEAGVRRCVQTLPAAQREALLLRCVDDLSLAEIARTLGRTENSVKGLLHRAKEAVQQRMAPPMTTTIPRERCDAKATPKTCR